MGRRSIQLACACAFVVATATCAVQAQSPKNTAMQQQVANEIKQSGQLHNYRLGVKYQDGVAWLLGTVRSPQQEQAAIELAYGVEGVDQVISKLEVVGNETPEEVREPVEQNVPDELVSPVAQLPAVSPAAVEPIEPVAVSEPATMSEPVAMPVEPATRQMAPLQVASQPLAPQPMRSASQLPRPMTPGQASAIRTAGGQHRPMPASYCGPGYGGGGYGGGGYGGGAGMGPMPAGHVPNGGGVGVSYDNAHLPGYAWPSYAAYPNYAALTYPKQYSPTAWPYIGPFYPYPQVPLGWRKVTLEWDDGWWMLDFSHSKTH